RPGSDDRRRGDHRRDRHRAARRRSRPARRRPHAPAAGHRGRDGLARREGRPGGLPAPADGRDPRVELAPLPAGLRTRAHRLPGAPHRPPRRGPPPPPPAPRPRPRPPPPPPIPSKREDTERCWNWTTSYVASATTARSTRCRSASTTAG